MRRAIPYPCNGPIASRVFKTMSARVPCQTSLLFPIWLNHMSITCWKEMQGGSEDRVVETLLRPHGNRSARIPHHTIGLLLRSDSHAAALADEHHAEGSLLQHPREGSLARADGERPRGLIPLDGDGRVNALFVTIAVALVFVKDEGGVCAPIHAQLNRVHGLLRGVLQIRSHGD